jgi:hypothetical protein
MTERQKQREAKRKEQKHRKKGKTKHKVQDSKGQMAKDHVLFGFQWGRRSTG